MAVDRINSLLLLEKLILKLLTINFIVAKGKVVSINYLQNRNILLLLKK